MRVKGLVCTASLSEAPPHPSSPWPGLELGGCQEHSVRPGLRKTQSREGVPSARRAQEGSESEEGKHTRTPRPAPPSTWGGGRAQVPGARAGTRARLGQHLCDAARLAPAAGD